MEENIQFTLDAEAIADVAKASNNTANQIMEAPKRGSVKRATKIKESGDLINCLSNRKVTVSYIPQKGTIDNPKHVMYGGLAEGAYITLTVPRLRSGVFKNVLTDSEKDYLEYIMGLEPGSLNVYNKTDNFWDNSTEGGISVVRLSKEDTILDLSSPVDYIKYKILLANSDIVAPNRQVLQDKRKATYRFVLETDNEVNTVAVNNLNIKMQCYTEFTKIQDNPDVLRAVVELLTSKPLAKNTKIEFLRTKTGDLIEQNPKMFLGVVTDPLLQTKVLIEQCVEQGFISKRGDYYYLRSDGTPLCEGGQDPVLSNAARYLNDPKRQEMKFALEAKLKE